MKLMAFFSVFSVCMLCCQARSSSTLATVQSCGLSVATALSNRPDPETLALSSALGEPHGWPLSQRTALRSRSRVLSDHPCVAIPIRSIGRLLLRQSEDRRAREARKAKLTLASARWHAVVRPFASPPSSLLSRSARPALQR